MRKVIISPPKDKPYHRLRDELVRGTFTFRQKKLSQHLHKEQGGGNKPSQFLRRLKRLTGEGNEDSIVRHIFLHRFQIAYHAVLAAVGEDAPIEKLSKIADTVANLTSGATASISAVQTPGSDPLVELLKG